MKKLKKRFIVPAVVFILGMCALIGAIYVVGEDQKQQNRTKAKLNAMTYAEQMCIRDSIHRVQRMRQTPETFLGIHKRSHGHHIICLLYTSRCV